MTTATAAAPITIANDVDPYLAFLAAKKTTTPAVGFDVADDEIHPYLMPHARATVQWMARGGRRAVFAKFGLHKTLIQIEWVRLMLARAGGRGLIVIPLGVRQEFFRDAAKVNVRLQFIQSIEDATDPGAIYLTNYETIREGKLSPADFTVLSLDEAAVLRSFGSKTFSEFLFSAWCEVPYRAVATATPDPNDHIELLGYAQFLDVMDIGHAKTRFFKRDSEKADHLTLHVHKEDEFWLWVATWALIIEKPSDLGFSDEGFKLPTMRVRWHEVASDHTRAVDEKGGQGRLYKEVTHGVTEAAREKRDSLPARLAKLLELRAIAPAKHRIIWHDLEDERRAIEAACPGVVTVYGTQSLDEREANVIAFSDGEIAELATKPVISGAGCNFQRHCAWEVFLGIGYKFHDLIQAIHRICRFGQPEDEIWIDLIYSEAERPVRYELEAKWKRHDEQSARVSAIVREYGLARLAMAATLERSFGVERVEVAGDGYTLINNDCVLETRRMASNSVAFGCTSIPFSTQYEYTAALEDFGHTDNTPHFWRQQDFLTPEVFRVMMPGRVLAVHVKDRIAPGAMTGLGYQTVVPFHCEATLHYLRHGFTYMGMITVVTDVVKENAGTHRLSYTQQCKDGSRMGAGMPEYILIFRKPPTDASDGYADVPVRNEKSVYTRARWQLDAHALWRSNGNRLLAPDELARLPRKTLMRRWKQHDRAHPYDYEHHVTVSEALERAGQLSPEYMVVPPQTDHPDVWSDVERFKTLNTDQAAKGREKHICPLQFDIVDRLIERFSMPGELVYDPFGGLMTVPYRAIKKGRRAIACELNARYFGDGAGYVERAAREREFRATDLFDLVAAESDDTHQAQEAS